MIPVAMNLSGVVESPSVGPTPYRIDEDGRPYVPVGDGGVVLGVHLGDALHEVEGDHVAPGATLSHPDPAVSLGLTSYACIGNPVVVRDGAAAGARGWVLGKRGEHGRVLVTLPDEALAVLQPGDGISVRAHGQGAVLPGAPPGVQLLNLDPGLLVALGIAVVGDRVHVPVRGVVPGRLAGNGVGRPAHQWDVDLAFPAGDPVLAVLRLGDLVAVTDLDVRHNIGYRRGWVTVGVVIHGDSPQPGHGPGVTPVLTGPASAIDAVADLAGPTPLTWTSLSDRSVATGGGSRAR
ncbi:DUF4438 domain-containing protein [Phycicoccus duodecadis]|uniref:Uncharacterized protein DUF4438 n=1 Tax=Phycicoccus duodecadis TaxID=173053 RepID=A0A2N3YIA0_9MICO|nr:DUF4438 domain-containing protein [Phycicoccus duodecadis]PKW26587.1 uncharacterized protein DUF4438 [Phycicoccus duodecadis]